MERKIIDILEDMDKLDEIEITDELVNSLKNHFRKVDHSDDFESDN